CFCKLKGGDVGAVQSKALLFRANTYLQPTVVWQLQFKLEVCLLLQGALAVQLCTLQKGKSSPDLVSYQFGNRIIRQFGRFPVNEAYAPIGGDENDGVRRALKEPFEHGSVEQFVADRHLSEALRIRSRHFFFSTAASRV